MDKFQGIFDQGFSGILEENPKNKMPDYLEKLADQEKDYEPEYLETPNILFNKDSGLSRANELTSDGSRESNRTNRFTIEKNEREAQENKPNDIDKLANSMKGESFDKIHASLLEKYPNELVNKYLESKIKLILNKFAYLGFESLSEKKATIAEQSKTEFRIKRSMVHDVLDKFSKLEYVSNNVTKQYKDLLGSKRPLYIVAKFLFSLEAIRKDFYENKEARTTFQRDIDKKISSLRDVDNNTTRSAAIAKQNSFVQMLNEFKQGIYNRMSRSQINQKLAKSFGLDKLQEFHSKFNNEIVRIERFANRQTFDTDFASAVQQGKEIEPRSKPISIDSKAMLNYAFEKMTSGSDLESVYVSLKKKFGREAAMQFLSDNNYKLLKHYGQLGYLFIDSNIYSSCDEMASSFSKLQHTGSKLIYSLRANAKCMGCTLHKEGHCDKTGLLVSNNPIVRSPRAAKRVFDKASSFVPKHYIESFVSQVKKEDSNLELVSKFALGIDAVLETEKRNIGKQASKNRTETMQSQEEFVMAESYGVDLFNEQGDSKIIDDIMKEASEFTEKMNGWNVEVSTHITKGADPTQVMTVKLKKGNEEIKLTEFQGLVKIDWKADKKENVPNTIPISNFAGADKTKDLNKLLSSVGAPTWTQIEKEYGKYQDSLSDY